MRSQHRRDEYGPYKRGGIDERNPNRVCIIGAGSSGITACKVLHDHGIAFDCNDLPLFHRVFSPQHRDLFFIGLLQPLEAIMPLADLQSIWVSKYLLGGYTLPSIAEMIRDIHLERITMRKRYGNSPRHTMQVDFEPYVMEVQKEMRRGAKRSATPIIQREATYSG